MASFSESKEVIEYCLSCPWDECWNCLGGKNEYCIGLRIELGDEKLIRSILKNALRKDEPCTKN